MRRRLSFLFMVLLGILIALVATSPAFCAPLQTTSKPLTQIKPEVIRCRGRQGRCIQYTQKDHRALLKRLLDGQAAKKRSRLLEQQQATAKQLDAKRDRLLQARFTLWTQERGLWRQERGNLLEQKKTLTRDNDRKDRRIRDLEKEVARRSLLRQPAFWGVVVGVVILAGGTGVAVGMLAAR